MRIIRLPGLWALGALLFGAVVACSGSQASTSTPAPSPTLARQTPELVVVLGSTDLAVGQNRVVFALLDSAGELMRQESVDLSFYYVEGSEVTAKGQATAVFRQGPYDRGVYVVQDSFDRAGTWILEVDSQVSGQPITATALFEVSETSTAPALGLPPPRSHNKTIKDVERLEELTTDSTPDEDLYSMTIAEALDAGIPLVVTFATPAFCQSATCGPQVDVVEEVKAGYPGRANFIHVEVFDNPHEILGDMGNARLSPTMEEWRLQSEPFTFVMDAEGNVAAKFEGFVTAEELDLAVQETLS